MEQHPSWCVCDACKRKPLGDSVDIVDKPATPVMKLTGVFGPGSENMVEACRLVNGPRQADYGTPKENYEGVAKVFSGILSLKLKADITPEEAALMMVGLKLQRQAMKHKTDNLVDAHGYLLVYEHIRNGQ